MGADVVLGNHGRDLAGKIFHAPAQLLARAGVKPNHVTVGGTVVSTLLAISLLATHQWVLGPIALGIVLFADSLDGTLARITSSSSSFGAFLDSTLDRISDGAVFASLAFALAVGQPSPSATWALIAALTAVVFALVVPYARARAQAEGVEAKLGIAERTDRLIVALVGTFLVGIGLPTWVLATCLTWVAFASFITTLQRIGFTRRELNGK